MKRPNVELLLATLAHIERHPDQLNPEWWRYVNGMCFGGHAVTLAGGRWAVAEADDALSEHLIAEPDDDPATVLHLVSAEDRAKRVLGLNDDQARMLFSYVNDLPALRRIVARLVQEAGR